MLGFVAPSPSSSSSTSASASCYSAVPGNPRFAYKYDRHRSPALLDHDFGLASSTPHQRQDAQQYVVWGISSLSLCSAQGAEPEPRHASIAVPECERADLHRSDAWPCPDASAGNSGALRGRAKDVDLVVDGDKDGSASGRHGSGNPSCTRTRNVPRDGSCNGIFRESGVSLSSLRSSPALDVVDEDRPWDSVPPRRHSMPCASSSSTLSSESSAASPSSSSSIGNSELPDNNEDSSADIEVESPYYPGTPQADLTGTSVPPSSPLGKGLSRFYSGKSRSFSCLGDVMSVKEMVKPENPYAKKRRQNHLPPLLKGVSSISKKPLHTGVKTRVALGMALSSLFHNNNLEEAAVQESKALQGPPPPPPPPKPIASRSYSLSDLQGACGLR